MSSLLAADLPESLEPITLKCLSDFNEHDLLPPNATDDCDASVIVEKEIPPLEELKCKQEFEVVWTALDSW